MPAAVPPAVARSFESLTPTIIIILGMSAITMWLGIDVHSIVGTLIKPLVNATDTLPSTLIIIFLIMFSGHSVFMEILLLVLLQDQFG